MLVLRDLPGTGRGEDQSRELTVCGGAHGDNRGGRGAGSGLGRGSSPVVDFATMSHGHDQDEKLLVFDLVHDAVVAGTNPASSPEIR